MLRTPAPLIGALGSRRHAFAMPPRLRIARPVTDLARTLDMYLKGLGLSRLGHFSDHDGFDGEMVGAEGTDYHFEFVNYRRHPVKPNPTDEDLIVFYIPDKGEWAVRCVAMLDAGFREVGSFNLYWAERGRTFEDNDGYRIVVECAEWDPGAAKDEV